MAPVLILGPLRIAWYSLVMIVGLAAALAWLAWADVQRQRLAGKMFPHRRPFDHRLASAWLTALYRAVDDALPLSLAALVCGRFAYVAAQWPYFNEHLWQALRFWEGGLSAHGALAGCLALLAWQGWRQPDGGAAAADRCAIPLLWLQLATWIACWRAGCAFGRPVDIGRWPWLAVFDWPDFYGVFLPRIPVQGLGALISLALLAGAWRFSRQQRPPGELSGAVLFLGALADAGLQLLRGDEAWLWLGQRAALGADLVFMILGAACFALAWRRNSKCGPNKVKCKR